MEHFVPVGPTGSATTEGNDGGEGPLVFPDSLAPPPPPDPSVFFLPKILPKGLSKLKRLEGKIPLFSVLWLGSGFPRELKKLINLRGRRDLSMPTHLYNLHLPSLPP